MPDIDLEQEDGLPDGTVADWAGDKVRGKCLVCGKEFSRVYRVNSRAVTCSKECSRKHRSDYRKRARKTPEYKAKMAGYRARWQANHPDYVPPPQPVRKTITVTRYNELLAEIERLHEALLEIAEFNSVDGDAVYMMDIARRALGEAKDE